MSRDGSSGGVIRLAVITEGGVERLFVPGDKVPGRPPCLDVLLFARNDVLITFQSFLGRIIIINRLPVEMLTMSI